MASATKSAGNGQPSGSPNKLTATATAGGTVGQQKAPAVPQRAPAFKIESVASQAQWLNLLVYADYGMGKTTLAGTADDVESMRDVILLDAESGSLPLKNRKRLDIVRIRSFKPFTKAQEYLKLHCQLWDEGNINRLREIEANLKGVELKDIKEPRHYRTVIIDSLTEIDAFSLAKELGVTETTKLEEDIPAPEWADYGRNFNSVQRVVRAYRDLPMHVILICSANYSQDDRKATKFHPAMTGKLARVVQGFMDMVGYLAPEQDVEGKSVRRLHITPGQKWDAKNRFSDFKDPHIDNPTMEGILEAINLQT